MKEEFYKNPWIPFIKTTNLVELVYLHNNLLLD